MFFVDVSRHRFPCTCYKSFFLGRKTCSLLMCLGLGIVSHVHVINLSSLEERHVLCCCVSASCFPCTCYRSFFLGRKTCSLLMCLGIVSHVHVINLFSLEGRHVICCCVSASSFPCTFYRSFFCGRKTCSLLLCLGIMFPMYML